MNFVSTTNLYHCYCLLSLPFDFSYGSFESFEKCFATLCHCQNYNPLPYSIPRHTHIFCSRSHLDFQFLDQLMSYRLKFWPLELFLLYLTATSISLIWVELLYCFFRFNTSSLVHDILYSVWSLSLLIVILFCDFFFFLLEFFYLLHEFIIQIIIDFKVM